MQIRAGAKMTQMEHRLVVARFKDGYGPVGMWFLLFKSQLKNSLGQIAEEYRAHELEEWAPYGTAKPVPTPLRNHLMLNEIKEGLGPHYLRTDEALQRMFMEVQNDPKKIAEIESDAWEDFLDMTMSQAHIWASQNIDPAKTPSELILTEPYLMGSHASATGAWCSGPEDAAPEGYLWGYNRMTTVKGLFAAGDACGASAHKFSSGSYTEGRLAGKAAVQYVIDNNDVRIDQGAADDTIREIYKPFNTYGEHQHETSRPELNANYILPKMALHRIQKIMDEYAAGPGNYYMTNGPTLERGLELMQFFREDCEHLAARDLHDLLRVLGGVGPRRLGRGLPAAHAVPRGDPLAGLLLPRRLPQARREPTGSASSTPGATRRAGSGSSRRCPSPPSSTREPWSSPTGTGRPPPIHGTSAASEESSWSAAAWPGSARPSKRRRPGSDVYLVEQGPSLGGRVAQLHQYFPKLCPPYCGLEINFRRIRSDHRHFKVFTLAQVESVSGVAGDYEVTIRLDPRYVINDRCIACNKLRRGVPGRSGPTPSTTGSTPRRPPTCRARWPSR